MEYLKEHYTKLLSKSTSVISDGLPDRSRSTTVPISQKCLNASSIQVKLGVFFPNSGHSFRLTTVVESNLAINKTIYIMTFLCTNIYLKVYRTKLKRLLCNIIKEKHKSIELYKRHLCKLFSGTFGTPCTTINHHVIGCFVIQSFEEKKLHWMIDWVDIYMRIYIYKHILTAPFPYHSINTSFS